MVLPPPETAGQDMRDFRHTATYIDEAREATARLLVERGLALRQVA